MKPVSAGRKLNAGIRMGIAAAQILSWVGVLLLAAPPAAAKTRSPHVYPVEGAVAYTHDPSMAKEGGTYYIFATGKAPGGGQLPIRCSEDLIHWRMCGEVFSAIPEWIQKRSPGTRDLWAPDVSYSHGEYRVYYAYSLFGKNTSGIALVTNKTLDPKSPEYKWVDRGLVLESKASDDFNAIDPNYVEDAHDYVEDAHGGAWLAFGSFWSGIKMRALDPATGKLSTKNTTLYSLAKRVKPANAAPAKPGLPPDWEAIEAPFIVRHGGYYYLFVSFDLCCRGVKSTYRTMVGRSRSVTGPYVDKTGKPMMEGGGSLLLSGNSRWVGPGGESVLMQTKGPDLIVFHAYDAKTGRPSMQLSTLVWRDGWPAAALGKE